jgi:RNA polymerase sigma factor (sigma-70 family)
VEEAAEFRELLKQAAAGNPDAMADLARRYEPEVRIVARARLSNRLRPYLDSMDITQSVHRSLMDGLRLEKYDIASPEKLVGLAVTIVRRKIARHWRKLRRQHRDSIFDQSGTATEARTVSVGTAVDAVDADDEFQYLVAGLSDTDRKMMEMRLAGFSTAEAARQLGLDPDVVRVRLSRLRQRLRRRREGTA